MFISTLHHAQDRASRGVGKSELITQSGNFRRLLWSGSDHYVDLKRVWALRSGKVRVGMASFVSVLTARLPFHSFSGSGLRGEFYGARQGVDEIKQDGGLRSGWGSSPVSRLLSSSLCLQSNSISIPLLNPASEAESAEHDKKGLMKQSGTIRACSWLTAGL